MEARWSPGYAQATRSQLVLIDSRGVPMTDDFQRSSFIRLVRYLRGPTDTWGMALRPPTIVNTGFGALYGAVSIQSTATTFVDVDVILLTVITPFLQPTPLRNCHEHDNGDLYGDPYTHGDQ